MQRPGLAFIIGLFVVFVTGTSIAEDLSLARAEMLWREANFELKQAKGAVGAARGDRVAADRRENPTLSLSATSLSPRAGLGAGSQRDRNADSVVRMEQLFERGGKRELRTLAAESRHGQSGAGYAGAA